MLQPNPQFKTWIARANLSIDDLAERTNVQRSTIYAWVHRDPAKRPRRAGIQRRLAWRVANAYAATVGVREEEAFSRLFVEVTEAPEIATT
jgi:hypothetical protein